MQKQRVRVKQDPKIELIDREVFEQPQESTRTPEWEILLDGAPLDCENIASCKQFEITVKLELLVSAKAIEFRASPELLQLQVGRIYFLALWPPFAVTVASLSLRFDCEVRTLTITGTPVDSPVPASPVEKTITLTPVELGDTQLLYDIV